MENYKWAIFKEGCNKRLHLVVDEGELWGTILVEPQYPYLTKWFTTHRYVNERGEDYETH